MKKIIAVSVFAVFALLFTSCSKDYTCTCTYNTNGAIQTSTSTINASKRDAEKQCVKEQKAYHGNLGYTYISCSL